MYGIETININNTDIMVSSKERTLIDLIYFNKPVGGVSSAVSILKEIIIKKECDINKLIEYTAIFPNVTVRKRIGVVLQNIGIKTSVLRPLAKSVENTAISSLNASRRGEINKK
jgi:predicted transcriptional regulator of viral defense system